MLFAQISKVDEEKRLVYGRATQEVEDRSGEIFDYESSKPYFEKWSDSVKKDSGGKSLGNVRAMHSSVAVGKLTSIDFNDSDKAIDVVSKIIDDAEWKKVIEGVYTGFSIGGSYVKRWDDKDDATIKRFTANPVEISIVDRPCVPSATFFDIAKADGSVSKVDFKNQGTIAKVEEAKTQPEENVYEVTGTEEDIAELAKVLAEQKMSIQDAIVKIKARDDVKPAEGENKYGNVKFADAKNKKYPIDTEEHIRAAWSYINKKKNADKYSADDLSAIKSNIESAWKKTIDKEGPPSASEKADYKISLAKSLYTCGSLITVLSSLQYIVSTVEFEEEYENDGSDIGTRLKTSFADLGAILQDMVAEEVEEAVRNPEASMMPQYACFSDNAKDLVKQLSEMKKIGAQHSKSTLEKMQSMHDTAVDLGAKCSKDDNMSMSAKADMQKVLDQNVEFMKMIEEAKERILKLESQPMPTKTILRTVSKAADIHGHESKDVEIQPVMYAGKENEIASDIKKIQKTGGISFFGK